MQFCPLFFFPSLPQVVSEFTAPPLSPVLAEPAAEVVPAPCFYHLMLPTASFACISQQCDPLLPLLAPLLPGLTSCCRHWHFRSAPPAGPAPAGGRGVPQRGGRSPVHASAVRHTQTGALQRVSVGPCS
jgi:hypothetical protein